MIAAGPLADSKQGWHVWSENDTPEMAWDDERGWKSAGGASAPPAKDVTAG